MSVAISVLVVLHLLGAAAIIGPWLAAPRRPRIAMAMVWGARAQLVTGLVLVGLHEMSTDPAEALNHVKIGVKLLVALACAACAEIARARQARAETGGTGEAGQTAGLAGADRGPRTGERAGGSAFATVPAAGLTRATALLAVLNLLVAVLWT